MNPYVALRSVLYLLGLWFFVYYFWRDYRLDSFRDHIFSVRDRLFLYAAQGNISFDHPAYTLLRNRMNVVLRYAHEFTLSRMLVILVTHDLSKGPAIAKWEESVAELPEPARTKIKEFNTCFAVAMLQHMLYISFFRYVVIRPLMVLVNPWQVREVVERPQVASSVERLESDALEQEASELSRRRPVLVA